MGSQERVECDPCSFNSALSDGAPGRKRSIRIRARPITGPSRHPSRPVSTEPCGRLHVHTSAQFPPVRRTSPAVCRACNQQSTINNQPSIVNKSNADVLSGRPFNRDPGQTIQTINDDLVARMRPFAEPVARLLLTFWLALLAGSDMALAASPLLHHSHEVLQADFCSGYIDQFGKWNTGFPCPWVDSTVPGFCCGTEHYKYCCSGKMMLGPAPPPPPPPPPPEDPLLLVLAITLGVAAGITLLILVACFVCPGCLLHKKRRPGPLYRLPCSSTMSTYVPSAANGPAAQAAHHQSASFQSFNSASGNGGVSSLYSLTEPLCPASGQPGRAAVISSGPLTGEDSTASGEMNRPCHHLYWNRPSLSRASSLNHQRQPQQQQQLQHLVPVRQAITNHQGHLRSYQDDPSPPPPYDADLQQLHQVEAGSSRATSVSTRSGHRAHHHHHHHHHHVHPGQSHAGGAEMPGFRQPVSSISPRQPALCIIDDVRRADDPPLAYHSTKF